MTSPKTPEQLACHIKALVDDYVREVERSALDAVGRAFSNRHQVRNESARAKAPSAKPGAQTQRRTPEQLAELADDLAATIASHPGEAMATFAEQLGVSARDLHRPMTMLKRQKRIRSVGERQLTRYFPAASSRVGA